MRFNTDGVRGKSGQSSLHQEYLIPNLLIEQELARRKSRERAFQVEGVAYKEAVSRKNSMHWKNWKRDIMVEAE